MNPPRLSSSPKAAPQSSPQEIKEAKAEAQKAKALIGPVYAKGEPVPDEPGTKQLKMKNGMKLYTTGPNNITVDRPGKSSIQFNFEGPFFSLSVLDEGTVPPNANGEVRVYSDDGNGNTSGKAKLYTQSAQGLDKLIKNFSD